MVCFPMLKVRKQAEVAAQLFVLRGSDGHPRFYEGRGRLLLCSCFSHLWYGFILQMPFIFFSSLLRSMHK